MKVTFTAAPLIKALPNDLPDMISAHWVQAGVVQDAKQLAEAA